MEFTFTFSADQINIILRSLAKQPYEVSARVIEAIHTQAAPPKEPEPDVVQEEPLVPSP